MLRWFVSKVSGSRISQSAPPTIEHGPSGIKQVGHREYVGGLWEEIGRLQFEMLVKKGLCPNHVFLDIACGSLRGGRHFIPYLNRGNYLGIDKEAELIRIGIETELGIQMYSSKCPELIVSADFEFDRFSKKPHYALAQSLFTHLPLDVIEKCLQRLRSHVGAGCLFYATFFETHVPTLNPTQAHDHGMFRYTHGELEQLASRLGWRPNYIGDWSHPRGQMLMEMTAV